MKRRCALSLGALAAIIAGALTTIYVFFGDPINYANFQKIKRDMTEAEVTAILGEGSETTEPWGRFFGPIFLWDAEGKAHSWHAASAKTWQGSSLKITVEYSKDGTVEYAECSECATAVQSIRRWFGIPDPEFPWHLTNKCPLGLASSSILRCRFVAAN